MSEEVKNEFTFENPEYRQTYWHTCSHVMAQAVKRLWPEVKLAIGPSIDEGWYYDLDAPFAFTPDHMAQIETEIAPIVGSEQQAKDLIAYINSSSKDNEEGIWDANIFGKSVEQIVEDGIQAKISQMTDECQQKLQDTLQKIINDSNGGLICIII